MRSILPLTWLVPLSRRPTIRAAMGGTFCPGSQSFCLPDHWTLHLYHYQATIEAAGAQFPLQPGRAALFPPGVEKTYHFVESSHHYCAHFSFPGQQEGEALTRLPALTDFDGDQSLVDQMFEEMIAVLSEDPLRAEVLLWSLLLRLQDAGQGRADERQMHPAVRKACRWIEQDLARPIDIPDLARRSRFSHNHLIRLFREAHGMTIRDYIRTRRVARAEHLLQHTDLAIKQIAANTGWPDLQVFNKQIRRAFGVSPRALRAARRDECVTGVRIAGTVDAQVRLNSL